MTLETITCATVRCDGACGELMGQDEGEFHFGSAVAALDVLIDPRTTDDEPGDGDAFRIDPETGKHYCPAGWCARVGHEFFEHAAGVFPDGSPHAAFAVCSRCGRFRDHLAAAEASSPHPTEQARSLPARGDA